ncbi:MAG: phage tail tape measure protein, partial [Chloroflexia bacterium]|nr:phage tail tape measure protein [Chloroflexia bacterium]
MGDGLAPASRAMDVLKGAATKLGPALAGLASTAALIGGFKAVVSTAADFQTAITRVGAVSGASAHELDTLATVARDLGAKTSFSASQAAEGMQYLAMAGFSVNEVTAAMPGLLAAAAASQMDLGRTADIVSNVMTGFGLKAEEAGRVADVLVYTSNKANTNVEQLGHAMKYAAPVAAGLGISIEDTAAAIGRMSDAGIQGEMAGTALRGALIRLSAPSREAEALMRDLGMNLFTAEGAMKSLPEVVGEFEHVLGGMTKQQQTATLQTLVGTEAMAGFLGLLKKGSGDLADFSTDISESLGTAAGVAETMGDTFAKKMDELSSTTEEVALILGDVLLPVLTDLVKGVTLVVRAFGEWLTGTIEFARTYEDVLVPALTGVSVALTVYAAKVLIAQAGSAGIIPVLWAKTAAMGKLAVATLAASGPFVILAAAVAGATLVYRKWQDIADDAAQKWLDQNETYQATIT